MRFLGVVNPTSDQNKAYFLKTLADGHHNFQPVVGATPNYVREKVVDYHLPTTVDTRFTKVATGLEDWFSFGNSTLKGEGQTTWKFDPASVAGSYTLLADTEVEVEIGGQTLGQTSAAADRLKVQGRLVNKTSVGVGRAQYQALLTTFLEAERNFDGVLQTTVGGGNREASSRFQTWFAGHLKGKGETPTPANFATRLNNEGQWLRDAVLADFQPINNVGAVTYDAIQIVDAGGQVGLTWQPYDVLDGEEIYGHSDYLDRDNNSLKATLIRNDVSLAAKEWALAEYLNNETGPPVTLGFIIQAEGYHRAVDFSEWVSSTVSHELAHTFGITDSYYYAGKYGVDLPPRDIMSVSAQKLYFVPDHIVALQAALGVAPQDHVALKKAIKLAASQFNTATSRYGINAHLREAQPAPQSGLAVSIDGEEFVTDDLVQWGTVLADGAGLEAAVDIVTLFNEGNIPLQIDQVGLENGRTGFTIEGADLAGSVVDPGQAVNLQLRFDPTVAGEASDVLIVRSNDLVSPALMLNLTGFGMVNGGQIAVAFATDPFSRLPNSNLGGAEVEGEPTLRQDLINITNTGGAPLAIYDARLTQGDEHFQLTAFPNVSPGSPLVLNPGESQSLGMLFRPASVGLHRGVIEFFTDDPLTPLLHAVVVGTGLSPSGPQARIGNDCVAVIAGSQDNATVKRWHTDLDGRIVLDLPDLSWFDLWVFDPVSGLIAHEGGLSNPDLGFAEQPIPSFDASIEPDSDGDGLPDDIELAVGSDPHQQDSDSDGIDDFSSLLGGPSLISTATTAVAATPARAPAFSFDMLPDTGALVAGLAATAVGLDVDATHLQPNSDVPPSLGSIQNPTLAATPVASEPAGSPRQGSLPVGLVNGDFSVGDTAADGFGWDTRGGAEVVTGQGVLQEDSRLQTRFSETFVVPADAVALQLTLVRAAWDSDPDAPPDAFEVALLDAQTGQSLTATAAGLSVTDALLNLQSNGQVFFGPDVHVPGVATSGDLVNLATPLTIQIDLQPLPADTVATLYFDLLSFGPATSQVVIDDVRIVELFEPGIVVSPTGGLTTTEAGGQAQFSVVLTGPPTADVLVRMFSSDLSEGRLSVGRLTFTPQDWDVPQFVTVAGQDDPDADGPVEYAIITAWATSPDRVYHGMNPADVRLVNLERPTVAPTADEASTDLANTDLPLDLDFVDDEFVRLRRRSTRPRDAVLEAWKATL